MVSGRNRCDTDYEIGEGWEPSIQFRGQGLLLLFELTTVGSLRASTNVAGVAIVTAGSGLCATASLAATATSGAVARTAILIARFGTKERQCYHLLKGEVFDVQRRTGGSHRVRFHRAGKSSVPVRPWGWLDVYAQLLDARSSQPFRAEGGLTLAITWCESLVIVYY